jgi:hypothetical protein
MEITLKEYEEYIPFYLLGNNIDDVNNNVYVKIYNIINQISINGLQDKVLGYINDTPTYYLEGAYNILHISYRVYDAIDGNNIKPHDIEMIFRRVFSSILKKYIDGNPDIFITDVPYAKSKLNTK